MKEKLKTLLKFISNPHLLLCLLAAWFLTNGWSYVLFYLGTRFEIGWMIAVSSAYLAFLWLPVSPEKLLTLAIALFLLRLLFPNDIKTLAVLRSMREKLREKWENARKK